MTLEDRLDAWTRGNPGEFVTSAELKFIVDMRKARAAGVGYGWMQQIIEWEWQSVDPVTAWGPEYFERRLRESAGL